MSVQNGDRLVTKQDLADMYQGILPYLGGMPEMVANKFNRSDMYSTDEKMIGQWVDGKPLYQRTFTGTRTQSEVKISYDSDIDIIFPRLGFVLQNSGNIAPLFYYYGSDNKFQMYIDRANRKIVLADNVISALTGTYYVVMQYTKTTDSSISIGSDTDYSTDEKIIGTWIDGKPVYQKTMNFGALPNSTTKDVAHNINNIDTIVNIFGCANDSTGVVLMLPFANVTGTVNQIQISATKSNVRIVTGIDRSSFNRTYITIQYTKTTD